MPHPPSHHTTTNFLSQEGVASEEHGPDDNEDPQSMLLEGERGHESSDNAGASPRPAEGDEERQPAKPKPPDITDIAAMPRTQDDSGGDVGVHRTHVVPQNPQITTEGNRKSVSVAFSRAQFWSRLPIIHDGVGPTQNRLLAICRWPVHWAIVIVMAARSTWGSALVDDVTLSSLWLRYIVRVVAALCCQWPVVLIWLYGRVASSES
ncbi:hypothetical protein BU15DRAFT_66360 [Melanogaster broomeanus]|nr:hypothetical protein BU15DRAFT_66360 [Melanogaster broomeanus]